MKLQVGMEGVLRMQHASNYLSRLTSCLELHILGQMKEVEADCELEMQPSGHRSMMYSFDQDGELCITSIYYTATPCAMVRALPLGFPSTYQLLNPSYGLYRNRRVVLS